MKNSKWNKYEAALLIDGYKRVVNGHASIKEVAMRISERIRPSNLQDCETYRNVNGITLQLGAIQFLMTDGAHGISHVSSLFREMVKLCNVQKITSAENLRSRASDEIVPFREFIIKDDTSALL